MFKKPFRVSQSSDLKSSVKRQIQSRLKDQFKNVTDATLWDSLLFPTKTSINTSANEESNDLIPVQVQSVKIELAEQVNQKEETSPPLQGRSVKLKQEAASKTKTMSSQQKLNLYTVNNVPMFAGLSNEDYMPTLFALHLVPNLLTPIVIHTDVSQYILSGADLMLPGLSLNAQPEFQNNELCALLVRGNPFPFAIGRMTFSHKKNENKPNNGKGKAMIIVHSFNDFLWQYGLTNNPNISIPEGFHADIIEPIQIEEAKPVLEGTSNSEDEQKDMNQADLSSDEQKQSDNKREEDQNIDTLNVENEEKGEISEKEIDNRMLFWFMETIKFYMKDKDLPMDTSAIYSRMTDVAGKLENIDVKKSSFKKLSKFIKHVSRLRYITAKDSGKVIVNINRSHPDYLKHEAAKKSSDGQGNGSNKAQTAKKRRMIIVTNLYKPTTPLNPIFESRIETQELYTEAEVRQNLINYIEKNKLRSGKENYPVKLDELLYRQLFHSKKVDSGYSADSTPPLQVVFKKLLEKMTGYYQIEFHIPHADCVNEDVYVTQHKGLCKGITIDVDKVMGNKTGTKINGLAPFLNYNPPAKASMAPLECPQFYDFIKHLKTKMSTGIKTNTELPPNHDPKKDPEVFIQGNYAKIIQDVLVQDYGIHHTLIHVTDNTSKKKKK